MTGKFFTNFNSNSVACSMSDLHIFLQNISRDTGRTATNTSRVGQWFSAWMTKPCRFWCHIQFFMCLSCLHRAYHLVVDPAPIKSNMLLFCNVSVNISTSDQLLFCVDCHPFFFIKWANENKSHKYFSSTLIAALLLILLSLWLGLLEKSMRTLCYAFG